MRIGDYEIHADSNEIDSGAGAVRLRPLLMQVLLRLAATPAVAVTREQLINDVWARKIVNDEVLSRAIAELRIALDDDSREPRYIETLPKVGYRLVATVSKSAEAPKSADPAIPVAPTAGPRRARSWMAISVLGLLVVATATYLWRTSADVPAGHDWARQINAAAPFASDPAIELAPRFSADGRQVVYIRRQETRSEVVVHDMRNGERRVVMSGTETIASPMFFPDGMRIAYWRRSAKGCEIVAHQLSEPQTAPRTLLDCQLNPLSRFDLSPDGHRLVFAARAAEEYPSGLKILDLGSGQIANLPQPQPGEGNDFLPRFSPDGSRIAFFRGSESHQRAWLVDASPPYAAKAAATVEGLSYGLAWMGAQGPLLVAADWHGFRALNQLDLASGETRLLGARGARFPDIARDGHIVFENATYRANLWLTDADAPGKRKQLLWPSTRYSNQAEFSPDGKHVVFSSNREGTDGVFIGTLDSTEAGAANARRLPLPEGFRYIRPHWSPDGHHVLAVRIPAAAGRSTQQAIRIDVESGRHEVLAQAGNAVNAVHALGDSELLVGEIVDYAMRLIRIAANGEKKRLALPLVSEYAVNGNTLVYTLPQLTGATQCELDTLRCTPLKIDLDDRNRFDWTLARGAIWYLGENPNAKGRRALLRYNLATGHIDSHDFAPSGAGSSLAAGPDGKQLIVLQEEPPILDLMLAKPGG